MNVKRERERERKRKRLYGQKFEDRYAICKYVGDNLLKRKQTISSKFYVLVKHLHIEVSGSRCTLQVLVTTIFSRNVENISNMLLHVVATTGYV